MYPWKPELWGVFILHVFLQELWWHRLWWTSRVVENSSWEASLEWYVAIICSALLFLLEEWGSDMELGWVYDIKTIFGILRGTFSFANIKKQCTLTLGFWDLSHKLVDLLCSLCPCWCCHWHFHGKHLRHTLALWRSSELLRKFSLIAYFLSVFPCCNPKCHVCIICRHNINIGMHTSSHAQIKTPPKVEILGKSTFKAWDGHRNRTTQLDVVLNDDFEMYHLHSDSSHSAFSSLCYRKHHMKLLRIHQIALLILEWNLMWWRGCADMCWLSP